MASVLRVAIISLIVVMCICYYPYFTASNIHAFISENDMLAPGLFILICAVRPVLFFLPSMGLTIVAGILFGALWGTLYVALGGMLSTLSGYYFARWIGRDFIFDIVQKHSTLQAFEKRAVANGVSAVLYMRLFNLPWDIVSYWAGLQGIRFRDFYCASMIALLPASFVYTYFGSTLFTPFTAGFNVSLALILIMGSLPVAVSLYRKLRAVV